MKRFHVHVAVNDLAASVAFYSNLFGQPPSKHQQDYAKWMLEDPRLNFAISSRGHAAGVNHFGMQVDSQDELAGLKALADAASAGSTLDQGKTACCYANSEKHWTIDPQGVAWETYRTMEGIQTFGEDTRTEAEPGASACCVPAESKIEQSAAKPQSNACCS